MGQSSYADWFVNGMLSWIRSIANGVASMFQSESSSASSGNALMAWFADHWITLLIVLVVVGILLDWIVWMLRWRPYWLWFRKKRLLLDDDIDIDLSDAELERRFGPLEPRIDRKAHFHQGAALGRAGRPIYAEDEVEPLYGDEDILPETIDYEDPDIEDPFDGDALLAYEDYAVRYDDEDEVYDDEDDDYITPSRRFQDELRKYEALDEMYDEDGGEYDDEYDDEYEYSDEDEEEYEPDETSKRNFRNRERFINKVPRRLSLFTGLRRKNADPYDDDSDPFSVDDVAHEFESDNDDEFFNAVKAEPVNTASPIIVEVPDVEITEGFTPPLPFDQQSSRVYDWRTGYSGENPTANPKEQPTFEKLNANSRRARRRVRELGGIEKQLIEDAQIDEE